MIRLQIMVSTRLIAMLQYYDGRMKMNVRSCAFGRLIRRSL